MTDPRDLPPVIATAPMLIPLFRHMTATTAAHLGVGDDTEQDNENLSLYIRDAAYLATCMVHCRLIEHYTPGAPELPPGEASDADHAERERAAHLIAGHLANLRSWAIEKGVELQSSPSGAVSAHTMALQVCVAFTAAGASLAAMYDCFKEAPDAMVERTSRASDDTPQQMVSKFLDNLFKGSDE